MPRLARRVLLLVTLALLPVATLRAQLPGLSFSVGGQYAQPGGDFGDATDTGYGAYAKLELGLLVVGGAARVEVLRFSGDGFEDTVFGARLGPRIGMGLLKLGLDIGRYTELDRTGYTPNVSVALGPLEAEGSMTFFDGGSWLGLAVGYRF
jgi:hypothetical protein